MSKHNPKQLVQPDDAQTRPSALFVLSADWFFFSHRLALARSLIDRGWQVTVAAPNEDTCSEEKFRAEGILFIPLKLRRGVASPLRDLQSIRELRNLYKTIKPDIVHLTSIKPVIFGNFAAKGIQNLKIVNSISGLGYTFLTAGPLAQLKRRLTMLLYRLALHHNTSLTIFQNIEHQDLFVNAKITERRNCRIVYGSGIDTTRFAAVAPPSTEPRLLFASRILTSKGLPELVEAINHLSRRGVDVALTVAGRIDSTNPDSISESKLRQWHKEGKILWRGFADDVRPLLAETRIVVLPSHTEGLPRSLLEGAAAGRPLIATDIAGCRIVARQSENAELVEVNNSNMLAQAIACLLGDHDKCVRYGARSREIAQEFDDAYVLQAILDIYRELHSHPHASAISAKPPPTKLAN